METWLTLAPVLISVFALAVSVAAFLISLRRDRRDLFLSMHERLIDPDLQEGRRVLHARINSVEDVKQLLDASPREYALVNRALAMLDIFGMYVARGYIDKRVALEEWGYTYAKAAARAAHVIEFRAQHQDGWRSWPNLQRFGADAAAWVAENRAD